MPAFRIDKSSVEHFNTRADGVEHSDYLLSLQFWWLSKEDNLALRRMDSEAEFGCFVDDPTQAHKNNLVFIFDISIA